MSSSLVSVVLPTYNRSELLPEAVNTVLGQTYENLELILIDDGSDDDTLEVLDRLEQNGDRIRVLTHDTNRGLSTARNTGIEASRGKYIAFQDDDDFWLPEKIEQQVSLFEQADESVGLVYAQTLMSPENLIEPWDETLWKQEGDLSRQAYLRDPVFPDHGMVLRDALDNVGLYDEDQPSARDDTELWMRLAQHYEFSLLDEMQMIYRRQPDSMTRDWEQRAESLVYMNEKHGKEIQSAYEAELGERLSFLEKNRQSDQEIMIWGCGEAGEKAMVELEAHDYRPIAFIESNPSQSEFKDRPVFSPAELLENYVKKPPYILVESLYGLEIGQLLNEMGFRSEHDYALNLLSPLRQNLPSVYFE